MFYGRKISIDICINALPKEHTYQYDGITYIRLNVNELQVPTKYGKTHSVTVDTWKPDKHNQGKKTNSPSDDGLPF